MALIYLKHLAAVGTVANLGEHRDRKGDIFIFC